MQHVAVLTNNWYQFKMCLKWVGKEKVFRQIVYFRPNLGIKYWRQNCPTTNMAHVLFVQYWVRLNHTTPYALGEIMPSFELPIRSLSILFIFGALIAILWFPDNPHTPSIARALFWWFLALGAVRWIENGLLNLFADREGMIQTWLKKMIQIPSYCGQVALLVLGSVDFYSVLSNL